MPRMRKSSIAYHAPSDQYLRNTYVLPEIIFDPSLVLSPHVFLLGLLFADRAFDRVDGEEVLVSANQLPRLRIRDECNELRLQLDPKLDDVSAACPNEVWTFDRGKSSKPSSPSDSVQRLMRESPSLSLTLSPPELWQVRGGVSGTSDAGSTSAWHIPSSSHRGDTDDLRPHGWLS